MSATEQWVSRFAQHRQSLPGADLPWLGAIRERALDRFVQEGWPTSRNENWHHTSLAMLEKQSFGLTAPASVHDMVAGARQSEDTHLMVFVDGQFARELSDIKPLPAGAEIRSLSEALSASPDQVEALFGDESQGAATAALNTALVSDGAYIRLSRGVSIDLPVHLLFISATPEAASFPRNLIQAEAGAHAVIVEHYLGQGSGASLTNAVTRMQLGADANVTHLKLQQEDAEAFHLGDIRVTQEQGSVYNSHSMSFGARLARHDIATRFNGDHCETLLNGLYYVDGRRHVDHHTVIDHARPFGVSREYFRGVLDGSARGVFGGRILVGPGADKTDAVQRSDSLLLSRLAKADARPELEIYADDVKCAHGATVGQISAESLFYLRSRGLDEAHARHVLTYAFAAEAVHRIEPEFLRKRVATAIQSLVPGGAALGDFS